MVDDLDAEIDRLRGTGQSFRSDVVAGPGGRQILLTDPAGNLIERRRVRMAACGSTWW